MIILVEDNFEDRKIIEEALIKIDSSYQVFENGKDALNFMMENQDDISLIILAKTLPGLDGMSLLSSIKSHNNLKKIPVIMQTVDDEVGKQREAIELGVRFYMEKPINSRRLLSLLKASIRRPLAAA